MSDLPPDKSKKVGDGEMGKDNWWEGLVPEVMLVSDEAFEELLEMMEQPPQPTPALVELFQRSRKFYGR